MSVTPLKSRKPAVAPPKSGAKSAKKKINNTVVIRKANELVEARYKFDIWETRLFLKMLTMIRSDDKDFNEYKIYISDFIHDFSLENNKDTYLRVKEGARKLMSKIIKVLVKDEGNVVELETPIIGAVKRTLEEGDGSYIKLAFYPDMKPFLLELKNRYLVYDFKNVSNLPSPYYVRLYELLKQYEKIGERRFVLDELKDMLGITSEYKLYGHFKNKILDKAQIKLLENTDICFTYREIKKGRAVSALVFTIRKNKPTAPSKPAAMDDDLFTNYEMVSDDDVLEEVEEIALEEIVEAPLNPLYEAYFDKLNDWWGVNGDALAKRLTPDKTADDVERAIEFTKEKIKAGKAENPAGLFLEALTKGFQTPQQHQATKKVEQERLERERLLKLKPLQLRYEALAEEYGAAVNNVIRGITKEDPSVTERVIDRIKAMHKAAGDPRLEKKTIDDFRKNPALRELVKTEMMKAFPERFASFQEAFIGPLKDLSRQIKELEKR